uniref:Uncharacterized protein LOC111107287 isoform X2 n=1 Tax=Crassostrea virginica TaxID=6565 RepID=A0A8B8B4W3_CRAVI|nr:uncharacterized protein LOC111107287 isoform X2 [Crassostrea virginica]
MRFEKGLPFILNICLFMNFVDANPKIFPFGKTCSLEPHQMNEDSTFYLSYFNISRPGELWCSYIAFSGQGSNSKDKFQICTTLNIFTDPGCNLKLTLRNSLNGTVLKTFSCMEYSKSKFCAKQGRDLYFVAEFQETDEKLRSDFLFHIEATKTYDHLKTLAGITGGAIGLVLLITIAIVIKCCKMRNNSPLVKSKFNIIDFSAETLAMNKNSTDLHQWWSQEAGSTHAQYYIQPADDPTQMICQWIPQVYMWIQVFSSLSTI